MCLKLRDVWRIKTQHFSSENTKDSKTRLQSNPVGPFFWGLHNYTCFNVEWNQIDWSIICRRSLKRFSENKLELKRYFVLKWYAILTCLGRQGCGRWRRHKRLKQKNPRHIARPGLPILTKNVYLKSERKYGYLGAIMDSIRLGVHIKDTSSQWKCRSQTCWGILKPWKFWTQSWVNVELQRNFTHRKETFRCVTRKISWLCRWRLS